MKSFLAQSWLTL